MQDLETFDIPAGTVIHVEGIPFVVSHSIYVLGTPGNAAAAGIDAESRHARMLTALWEASAPLQRPA